MQPLLVPATFSKKNVPLISFTNFHRGNPRAWTRARRRPGPGYLRLGRAGALGLRRARVTYRGIAVSVSEERSGVGSKRNPSCGGALVLFSEILGTQPAWLLLHTSARRHKLCDARSGRRAGALRGSAAGSRAHGARSISRGRSAAAASATSESRMRRKTQKTRSKAEYARPPFVCLFV